MQVDEEHEEECKEELGRAVLQLTELHTGLADCYKSLNYLEKFIKVRFTATITVAVTEFSHCFS